MKMQEIFATALEYTKQDDRTAYVVQACGTDTALRQEIVELLSSHDRLGKFLETPIPEQIHANLSQDTRNPATLDDDPVDISFLAPTARADSLGKISHYEVLNVLGCGGFGIVFRAFDEILCRIVAVKVLSPYLAVASPARKRFLREARSSASIRHEHVVQVYEVGEQPFPFIVMEYIPGEDLKTRIDRTGPLSVAEVLQLGQQMAEGLAAAHACDVIHCDIKPCNILLETSFHKVKLTDFGLARAANDASISRSGWIAGTPMYMSPEQALGLKVDPRSDLFSLGSVLYQLVSGRPPFRANSALAVMKRVAEDAPRPIQEIIPETPRWLCDIISKLHEKNPAQRFQTAREVADVLASCEATIKAGGRVSNTFRVTSDARTRTRKRWPRFVAAAVLLASVVLASLIVNEATQRLNAPQDVTQSQAETQSPQLPSSQQQIETVRAALKKRNPGFDGTLEVQSEGDQIVSLALSTEKVSDISPLQELKALQVLKLIGVDGKSDGGKVVDLAPLRGLGIVELTLDNNRELRDLTALKGMLLTKLSAFYCPIVDLTPLAGMPLESLDLWCWHGSDLTPLRGMPLKKINIGGSGQAINLSPLAGAPLDSICVNHTQVSDLSPLRGMPLTTVGCQDTLVSDLSPLRGMSLKVLHTMRTPVTDLSPIENMPLTWLNFDYVPKRDLKFIQPIKSLTLINNLPAAEFFKQFIP